MTENSKGLVTDLEAWYNESDGLELTKYIGTKRLSSSSGLVGFAYNTTDKDYTTWLGADDDATVAYYEPVGGSLSDVGTINSLKTDNNDEAYVITDEGTIIAILVKEFK